MPKFRSALLGASLFVTAAPLHAALYDITYTGVVSSGYDQTGTFLDAGASFSDNPFTAVFTLSYPAPDAYEYYTTPDNEVFRHEMFGGFVYGVPSFLSATITINGKTEKVAGEHYNKIAYHNGPGSDYISHSADDNSAPSSSYKFSSIEASILVRENDLFNKNDFTQEFSYTADSNDFVMDSFEFLDYDSSADTQEKYVTGNLIPSTVTILQVSAVPEQSTWAMMITAFGFAGTAFRRRKLYEDRTGFTDKLIAV